MDAAPAEGEAGDGDQWCAVECTELGLFAGVPGGAFGAGEWAVEGVVVEEGAGVVLDQG